MYGSVPQSILDEEGDFVRRLHERNSDVVYFKITKYFLGELKYFVIPPSSKRCSMWLRMLRSSTCDREHSRPQRALQGLRRSLLLPFIITRYSVRLSNLHHFEATFDLALISQDALFSSEEAKKDEFLRRIRGYRPASTILEVHSTAKATSKAVMVGKRLVFCFKFYPYLTEMFSRRFHDALVASQKRKDSLEEKTVTPNEVCIPL